LKVDPQYALAQAYLAFAEVVANNYDDAPHALLVDCKTRIDQARVIDPDDGRLYWLLAIVHGCLNEFDDEKRQLERALALNPNDANARVSYGLALSGQGQHEAGVRHIREAMRLNPFHPEWYWLDLGAVFLVAKRYEDAIEAYKRRTRPQIWVMARLASCYGHLGRTREAQEMVARILALDPSFRISISRRGVWSDEITDHIFEGMRRAGLPE
jgi:tetratricopeptide (TPR) repeat protein